MEAGYDVIKSFLKEYEKDNIPEPYWLYEISCNKKNEVKCKEDYIIGKKHYIIGTGIVPYSVSFSARRDYLPMWSLYGKTGKGVCLKFDVYKMIKDNSNGQAGFVAYNMRSCMRTMKEVIPQMYKWYMDDYKNRLNELSIESKLKALATICLSVSPYVKYRDYQYEKEFRLTFYHNYGMRDIISAHSILDFQQSVSEISSYLEIPISADSFKEVIMGPSMDKDSMKDIIMKEIRSCNLEVRVSESKIPFQI